jgi:polyribonucleotide nucleotidyltransferase
MFNNTPISHSLTLGDTIITLQTGLLAQLASASVLGIMGETTVLASVVIGKEVEMDFFPLQVIYEERLYASGKIKGSRFMKREGRPTDNAVLTGRLVDRSLRSLMPENVRNDIQVIITVLSLDEKNPPDLISVIAASAALKLAGMSDFGGPVSSVRVGKGKTSGNLILNPTYEILTDSDLDFVISGTSKNIVMLEAGANIVPEDVIKNALDFASPHLTTLYDFQSEFIDKAATGGFQKTVAIKKKEVSEKTIQFTSSFEKLVEEMMFATMDKNDKNDKLNSFEKHVEGALKELIAATDDENLSPSEIESISALPTIKDAISEIIESKSQAQSVLSQLKDGFELLKKKLVDHNILVNARRIDGRKLDETRTISCQVDVLPMVHGSSLFQRGETQVLNVLTLGTDRDAQLHDDMEDFIETEQRYIHHYNFPQYSVGETGRYTGPGRREIGHGALAERALLPVLPEFEKFPYTMRLVSETLQSNGSSSMASTCASTLSLMAGGVPIKEMIAGVAMGLVIDSQTGNFEVLTDIQGAEDHFGEMDFKITGSENGITAIQLDNKAAGLTVDILKEAIVRSKEARLHILDAMKAVISSPATSLSQHAPRVAGLTIPTDMIGDVIGPGGKIIKSIIAETGTSIDIADDTGRCLIYGKDPEKVKLALSIIKNIVKVFVPGEKVSGTVFRIEAYGAFIRFDDSEKEGMIHISRMSKERVKSVEDVLQMGQHVEATVAEINERGQIALSLV